MKPILYIETNFIIGVSKGQDLDGERLIVEGIDDITLTIPGVCFMEVLSVLVFEEKQRNRFHTEMERHLGEFRRNKKSPKARELVGHLERSRISSEELLNEFRARVFTTLMMIRLYAEIIQVDSWAISTALLWRNKVLDDPTDCLILSCIIGHARTAPDIPKAFVSHNFNDFAQPKAREKLDEAGTKYFKDVQKAVGWLRVQTPLSPDSS